MVKSVLSVYHQGLRDWLIQRVSAFVMAIYSIGIIGFFLTHPNLEYTAWHSLFSQQWMKVVTLLFISSLLFHAWVGMWTIFTDYIKPSIWRFPIHVFVFLALLTMFFWSLLILWGI